jgi:hypothetical protein
MFGFVMIVAAWLLIDALIVARPARFALAGIAFACAALVNQIVVGFSLLAALWLLVSRYRRGAVLFAALALLPPILWGIRDSHTHPPPHMSASSRLMENVLIGMEPGFIPRYKNPGDPEATAAQERINAGRDTFAADPLRELGDIHDRVLAEPGRYLLWYLSKPAQFWTWSIVQGLGDVYVYPMLVAPFDSNGFLRVVASLCHGLNAVILVLSPVGMIVLLRMRRHADPATRYSGVVLALVFLYATAIHTLLAPDARYATPFRPFQFVLAVGAVAAAAGYAKLWRDA